jgi:hypothetical protein
MNDEVQISLFKQITLEEIESCKELEERILPIYIELIDFLLDRKKLIEIGSRVYQTHKYEIFYQFPNGKLSYSDFIYLFYKLRHEKLQGQSIKEFLTNAFDDVIRDNLYWHSSMIDKNGNFVERERERGTEGASFAIILSYTIGSCIIQ